MGRTFGRIISAALVLALTAPVRSFAQNAAPSSAPADQSAGAAKDPALQEAAKKVFKAIADNNVDAVRGYSEAKYRKKLNNDSLRPAAKGPKLSAAFDGNVKVIREDGKHAVVAANIFKPDSSDIPPAEVSTVKVFMEKTKAGWLVDAPDKKEAQDDANTGGWYHPGSFTLCPNKGLVFEPNHFSANTSCESTAACEKL
ncbi:MAG TPA: hypothetical protein VEF03_13055 [Candidatus Binataceae bacterium]|nr:hypothetical protein [Candidatus Binataceae bacterium]